MDHHYGQEWARLLRTAAPSSPIVNTATMDDSRPYLTYRPAFSRDNPEGVKRTYVQDLMDEDREKVWDVVSRRGGWVYISGCVVPRHRAQVLWAQAGLMLILAV